MRILAVEGQFNMGLITKQLLEPMLKKHPGKLEIISASWADRLDSLPDAPIVIGHSLGGDAAIDYCKRWSFMGDLKALITLDPRHMSNWGWTDMFFRWQENFSAPDIPTFNFTHVPPVVLPGYAVNGSTWQGLRCNHFNICGQPEVFQCLEKIILGEK